jgi:type III pantothenate kinase
MEFTIVATGGLSAILTPLKDTFDEIDRNLTLEGLWLITRANQ